MLRRGSRRAARRAGRLGLGAAAALWFLLPLPAPAEEQAGGEVTRATMDRIYASIRFLLPQSLSDDRFQDPQRREEILAALDALAEDSARLESHGRELDASFTFLSRSLARDAREIRDRYVRGQHAESRFLLHRLTEDCVACHSRLPSDRAFPDGEAFVNREAIVDLPLEERAQLEVATRQFDRAIETYETLFASPGASPAALDLQGHFDDYLELCIRVRGDLARPQAVLEAVLARDDVTPGLRTNLKRWVQSLRQLRESPPKGTLLARAELLLDEAEDRKRFPNDRGALVKYVAASSYLHRHVAAAGKPGPELVEAYYLLGVIESRIGRSFWLSQTEHFLETAIRLDPSQPYASRALDLLEEFVVAGYTGSSGVQVPPDVQRRLEELRQLVDDAAPAAAAPESAPAAASPDA